MTDKVVVPTPAAVNPVYELDMAFVSKGSGRVLYVVKDIQGSTVTLLRQRDGVEVKKDIHSANDIIQEVL